MFDVCVCVCYVGVFVCWECVCFVCGVCFSVCVGCVCLWALSGCGGVFVYLVLW